MSGLKEIRDELISKRQEARQVRAELRATKNKAERSEHKKRKERAEEEVLRLERKLYAAAYRQESGEDPEMGALPDFVIIGQRKCGTSSLYVILTLHPYVERAVRKEPHFFDSYFDKGVEWYRQFFPAPKWEDGRRTITGEATPLMASRLAPERMAQVIPQVRLIALLRNPVDRTYSDYHQVIKKGRESRSFEEAIGLEGASLDENSEYISRGVYVDQLLRWSEFFSKEQMLVLKSEDFFKDPQETLRLVLDFLELPEWEPEASEVMFEKRNQGRYKEGMDQETRRRLEEYFEPHNKRLYEYLGVDFGW